MRILHITDTYLPRLGGIELHVSDLARRQSAAGHDVVVATAERPAPPCSLGLGAEPRVEYFRGGANASALAVTLAPLLVEFRPDVVHAHLSVGSPFAWAALRVTAGTPVVVSMHSLLPRSSALVRAGIRAVRLPTERLHFTAVSSVAAARLQAALPAGKTVHVLHNGIDQAAWQVAHEDAPELRILSVGRLVARKRPLVLVEALAQLHALAPGLRWSATLIGDGSQRRRVLDAVRAYGLTDRVDLPGALSRGQIRGHLASSDVFVAPATLESFGIAALEARCAGVPVVGMAASGVTEFVTHEVDGLLAHTDADLARSLLRIAAEPSLVAAMRRHSASTAVAMDWATVLQEHDLVYRECSDSCQELSLESDRAHRIAARPRGARLARSPRLLRGHVRT
ncbi:glycosyltransferase family 4 protein [Marmoricola sp. RAF53]|uniref:glycosyltransferase family 4 protein n=1 Tax=Marmoricola sp. RAF53 TaxID=3233059 RepID=UPI003F97D4FB